MISPKLPPLIRLGAIASLVLSSSMACQSSPDTANAPSSPDSPTATSPTEPTPAATPSQPAAPTAPATPTAPSTATAPPATAVAEQSCSTKAYIMDTDPAGLNVRSGPGSDFAAIDTLPTDGPVEVSIVGASSGWLLLNEAWSASQQELEQPGWVYAPLLGVSTTSLDINDPNAPATLYASPDGMASVKAKVPKAAEVTLLSCSGNWLEVQAAEGAGWLAVGEQCSNPEVPCP